MFGFRRCSSVILISILFLGCSDVAFEAPVDKPDPLCLNAQEDCFEEEVEEGVTKSIPHAPVDILFVLDDSVSMEAIIDKVRAGFASLANVAFPNDTRMAVTYMSPYKFD